MSPIGVANTIVGASVIDKVQNAQQLQIDIQQKQAEAAAVREQNRQRNTVKQTPDGEKVKMRERHEEREQRRRRRPEEGEEQSDELFEEGSELKHINIKV